MREGGEGEGRRCWTGKEVSCREGKGESETEKGLAEPQDVTVFNKLRKSGIYVTTHYSPFSLPFFPFQFCLYGFNFRGFESSLRVKYMVKCDTSLKSVTHPLGTEGGGLGCHSPHCHTAALGKATLT